MTPEQLTMTAIVAVAAGAGGLIVGFLAGRATAGRAPRTRRASTTATVAGEPSGEGIELYVGNLSYDMTDPEIIKTFQAFGDVLSARIIKNKFNDRSKGYGFVEMATQQAADKAVKAMHGKEIMGRKLVVNEARSRSRE